MELVVVMLVVVVIQVEVEVMGGEEWRGPATTQ